MRRAIRAGLVAVAMTLMSPSLNERAYSQSIGSGASVISADAKTFPGLDPKGIADSTVALQAVLDKASGKSLILPKGTYIVTSLALPINGIKIIGAGAKLVLRDSANDGEPILSIPSGSHNIQIDGLEIDGRAGVIPKLEELREALIDPKTEPTIRLPHISGIVSNGHTSGVVITNTYIHDIPLNAIQLSNGDADWDIAGNRIIGIGHHGIVVNHVLQQVHDLSIQDNHVDYCAFSPITIIADANGVASAGAANVKISRNYVSHNGLDINGYSPNNRDILIRENTIENNGLMNRVGHAIHFAGTNITIVKNIARNTAISAIVISAWPNANPTPTVGFDVSENIVENILSRKNAKGILIQNASSGQVSGNRISGTGECPIEVDGNALGHGGPRVHDVSIINNQISSSPDLGVNGICINSADNIITDGNKRSP